MKSEFKIIKNNTISLHDGEDNLYHVIPTGFEDKYLVVDGGPHFNGDTETLSTAELKERFSLIVDQKIIKSKQSNKS